MSSTGGNILVEDRVLAAGFVQVPIVVLHDHSLSAGAKLAYAELLWWAWRGGKHPGLVEVAEHCGMGERTLRRHVAELVTAEYITVRQNGFGLPADYVIHSLEDRPAKTGRASLPQMAGQVCQNWQGNESEVVLDVKDEYESDSLWITSVAERYGTSRRDRAALRTSLSKYPLDAVKWAVEELQGGMAVKNPGAWLNVVVPELAEQLDQRRRKEISRQERDITVVRATYGFYLKTNSPEKARAMVETDFGVDAVKRALESAA